MRKTPLIHEKEQKKQLGIHPFCAEIITMIKKFAAMAALCFLAFTLTGCGKNDKNTPAESFYYEVGTASWYGAEYQGKPTASGEIFDKNKLTAAHKTLPFGTWVEVYNLDNGYKTVLKINDRGPFVEGRIIDVSERAAIQLGMKISGLAKVGISIVSSP